MDLLNISSVPQGNALVKKNLNALYDEVRTLYASDNRPWVIGYSGGKDSTTVVQIIWYALSGLERDKLTKPVYIISSDTLVETPKIIEYLDGSLSRMQKAAESQGLPFTVHKVRPDLDDSFWVNMIGRGYPAPSKTFRWCTERLKIDPANNFIRSIGAKYGEVIVVLGVRKAESATRSQVMSLHRIEGSVLSRHTTLANSFVYTPIEAFDVDAVWTYLLQVPSPWGNNNRDLVTLYRNAQAGECPLVVDNTTQSCGNSRFGCWVCTVVNRDTSMEAMIENGEDWLEPLLEFRNKLAATQDPAVKRLVRRWERRNGRVSFGKDGRLIPGPYTLLFRKELLTELLKIQKQVRVTDPGLELISGTELEEIRRIWRTEEQDWEDSVPTIYAEAVGENLDWVSYEIAVFSRQEKQLLASLCEKEQVSTDMVAKLLDVERDHSGMSRRSSIYKRLGAVLQEDWRNNEEIEKAENEAYDVEESEGHEFRSV